MLQASAKTRIQKFPVQELKLLQNTAFSSETRRKTMLPFHMKLILLNGNVKQKLLRKRLKASVLISPETFFMKSQ